MLPCIFKNLQRILISYRLKFKFLSVALVPKLVLPPSSPSSLPTAGYLHAAPGGPGIPQSSHVLFSLPAFTPAIFSAWNPLRALTWPQLAKFSLHLQRHSLWKAFLLQFYRQNVLSPVCP